MNFHSSRLAARARIRQVEIILKAEAVAAYVDRTFARLWREIVSGLRSSLDLSIRRYLNLFNRILPTAIDATHDGLSGFAWWIHQQHKRDFRILPVKYLQSATVQRYLESELREDRGKTRRSPPRRPPRAPRAPDHWPRRVQPGAVEIAKAVGLPPIALTDPFREPIRPDMSQDEKRNLLMDVLFPPPPKEKVDSIVFGTTDGLSWLDRLSGATRTSATPMQLATTVAAGVAGGKTAQEVAKDLLPIVDGVRSTARRIARTECYRVATEVQLANAAQLGDLLIGHQIFATIDENTRSWHSLRSGTIYYINPGPGQKGLKQMPRPPLEAEDPAERPPGKPRVANN